MIMKTLTMFHIPAYYSFAIVSFIIQSVVQSMSCLEPNSSGFFQMTHKYDFLGLIAVQLLSNSASCLLHQLTYILFTDPDKKFMKKLATPPVFVNFIFAIYYILDFIINIVNINIEVENQYFISIDFLQSYVFKTKIITDSNVLISNNVKVRKAQNSAMVSSRFLFMPGHWAFLLTFIIVSGLLIVAALVLNIRVFYQSLEKRRPNNTSSTTRMTFQCCHRQLQVCTRRVSFKRPLFNVVTLLLSILAFIDVCLFWWFVGSEAGSNLKPYATAHWHLMRSASTPILGLKKYKQIVGEYRLRNVVEGRYYLDQRETPTFPLVTGNYQQFCSYNPDSCPKVQRAEPKKLSRQPNIYLYIVESLSPFPKYTNLDKLLANTGDDKLLPGQIYDEKVLPNLNWISQYGTTFLGTSSHGLPTINGWFSLFVGEKPREEGLSIVSSEYNHEDAFARHMRQAGYFTAYVTPTPLEFDGKDRWVFGRNWFDQVIYYYPNETQMQVLNLKDTMKTGWMADRITAQQLMYHTTVLLVASKQITLERGATAFQKQVEGDIDLIRKSLEQDANSTKDIKPGQPLFLGYMNLGTHTPFQGHDTEKVHTAHDMGDDYSTALRMMDHYVGDAMRYISDLDPSGVVAVVGDHGARERPKYPEYEEQITDNYHFDGRCHRKHFGFDNMFTTSAVIATYNDTLRQELGLMGNSSLNMPSDHDDLVKTLLDIAYSATDRAPPPTSRNGRNLMRMTEQVRSGGAVDDKVSVSVTNMYLELRSNDMIYRGSSFSPSTGVFLTASYPTCVQSSQTKNSIQFHNENDSQQLFKYGVQHIKLLDHVQKRNEAYNYAFEDGTCVYDAQTGIGKICSLPNPIKSRKTMNYNMTFIILFQIIQLLLGLLVASTIYGINKLVLKYQKNKRDESKVGILESNDDIVNDYEQI